MRGTDKEKTILLKKGVDRGALIYMEGVDDLNVQDTLKVLSHYVPVNARTLEVASGVSLKKRRPRHGYPSFRQRMDCLFGL